MNNQIKVLIRNFYKHKVTNLLSIGGLSIGIAISLLLGVWSLNELNFDSFNRDKDVIYRIGREGFINNETVRIGTVFAPIGIESKQRFPQIEDYIKLTTTQKQRFKAGEIVNYEKNIFIADSNFFQFFDYEFKYGDANTCLNRPNSIVINEKLAQKYFPGYNPIGQIVNIYSRDWEVTGVMKNFPSNSHIQAVAVCAMAGVPEYANTGWGNRDMYGVYFKLQKGTDYEQLALDINAMAKEQFPSYKQMDIHHFLQPLSDVHFATESFRFDYALKSDKRFVMIFIFMAIAILIIACINFTNLFISTSFLRAKSVGIKKANGANKYLLVKEFFAETSFFVLVSVFIGVGLAILFLPSFNQLANANVVFNYTNPLFYALIGVITLLTIIMAGTFPAFYITKFNPVATLKGQFKSKNVSGLQKSLVIIQFTASIILLIAVFTIKKQVHFIQNVDLGFNKSNVVYVDARGGFASSYKTIKAELEADPSIIEVTAKTCIPSDWNDGHPVSIPGSMDEPFLMENCQISENYFDMMDIAVVQGEDFSNYKNSRRHVLINEQAVKVLGLNDPIGKEIERWDERLTVVGVVENVKTKSLHRTVDPQVYLNMPTVRRGSVLMIKVTDDFDSAISAIRDKWMAENPDYPFDYHFLDNAYDELYKSEKRAGRVVTWGMGFALFITVIGLFAMARYTTERRIKEIGVRQVNGAKISDIIMLLNKDFLKWVFLAFLIAMPVSWYVVNIWLDNFAYKTNLSWWVFAAAGLLALFVALLTVSWQVISAALKNPVDALRYE